MGAAARPRGTEAAQGTVHALAVCPTPLATEIRGGRAGGAALPPDCSTGVGAGRAVAAVSSAPRGASPPGCGATGAARLPGSGGWWLPVAALWQSACCPTSRALRRDSLLGLGLVFLANAKPSCTISWGPCIRVRRILRPTSSPGLGCPQLQGNRIVCEQEHHVLLGLGFKVQGGSYLFSTNALAYRCSACLLFGTIRDTCSGEQA